MVDANSAKQKPAPNDAGPAAGIRRGRTALRRYSCSRPIALALTDGVVSPTTTVFDYGCGLGGDVEYLQRRGVQASGWDPHHAPDASIEEADVVHLGYVLNVIEDPRERVETLTRAYALARRALVVSVRVERGIDAGVEYGDGIITGAGTFQKFYTQPEFISYIETILGRRPYVASVGVAYVFRNETDEAELLARNAFSSRSDVRTELVEEFGRNRCAKAYVQRAMELGRLPLPIEFDGYEALLDAFGSSERIARLASTLIDPATVEATRAQRKADILTYVAMLRLQGLKPPPYSSLHVSIQKDIKMLWSRYTDAQREGTEFLFSLGKPEALREVCRQSKCGKLLPSDLYVHRSVEDVLPALLRVLLFAARRVVGQVEYDLVRIQTDGRAVSFLGYPEFDTVAHPTLQYSVRVYLPKSSYEVRDYRSYKSPPILHRKDALVSPTYPRFAEFRRLTEQEEALGLLSSPEIGTLGNWEALLSSRGLTTRDHEIISAIRDAT